MVETSRGVSTSTTAAQVTNLEPTKTVYEKIEDCLDDPRWILIDERPTERLLFQNVKTGRLWVFRNVNPERHPDFYDRLKQQGRVGRLRNTEPLMTNRDVPSGVTAFERLEDCLDDPDWILIDETPTERLLFQNLDTGTFREFRNVNPERHPDFYDRLTQQGRVGRIREELWNRLLY
jgi:hypothetical protein